MNRLNGVAIVLVALGWACGLATAQSATRPAGDADPVISLLKDVEVSVPGDAVYRAPGGTRGWYSNGFRREHEGTRDWRAYAGLRADLELQGDGPVELTATIRIPPQEARPDYIAETKATVVVRGAGAHRVTLPWSAFAFQQAQPAFLKFAQELRLSVKPAEGASLWGKVTVKDVSVVRGFTVSLDASIKGKSAEAGGAVEYVARVANCTDKPQAVALSFEKYGWEAMEATVEPRALDLAPGAGVDVKVRVKVSPRVAPGGRERQVLKAVPNGDAGSAAAVTFITAAALPHPYVLHNPQRWQEVRDKVDRYDWAKKARDEYVAKADKWTVPEVAKAPKNLTGVDNMGPFLFPTTVELDLMPTAIAYQLTGDKKYAEKVRTFVLRLSSPENGYPVTLRGCNQSLVQEGHFFQHIAMAYDMALPSGLFTDADKAQVERTFRLFAETIAFESDLGAINNWNLSEVCGALYSALTLQDLSLADRFLSGPAGVLDQLGKGVLDDGWWYECSISYNVWCATEFTQVALAMEPWGVNLRDAKVPASYVPNYSLIPWAMRPGLYGMNFDKFGPVTSNHVTIKRMWDALPLFTDYRGVMFGVNDATERRVTGEPYEIAYYVYRDPGYATLIKQGDGKRDLLYGVPELPGQTMEKFHDSAYADNVGVAMLRSQTPGRSAREQIQAVLHYGTHGGFHGHFDRTSLLHLSRYGRSFYNPEMVWYSYAPYMYKFYVQNSTSKNMVVVDRKMQEPVESQRLLWHAGKVMQATAVQTKARWSTPPYGGMVYPEQGYKTLHEKAFGEGRHLPVPEKMPEYGSTTEFTEPVLQRRAMVVTDDYVVLADYLKGEREHTFESLMQMKGFKGIEAADKKLVRHDGQWDANPILDAQFITDCDWYQAAGPARASFEMRWGPGADNEGTRAPESEDGMLKLDVHTLWPTKQELMIGTTPEAHPVEKRLFWSVRGDGKMLAEGKFGAWILGQDKIDVALDGVKQLELQSRVELSKKPTVFWASARVVTRDGKELPLSQLPLDFDNVLRPAKPNTDYFGGPVKIVGVEYTQAIPGQPKDEKKPAVVRVDLKSIDAVRLKAVVGGDYPLGDESQRRKTYASKVVGKEARFLTVIEPFEGERVVRRAEAVSENELKVELLDGRVQTIRIKGMDSDDGRVGVTVEETKDGKPTRSESTDN